jgi:hypothetical protein
MKDVRWRLKAMVGLSLSAITAGCAATPPPTIVHEDRILSVRLIADRRTEAPHSHPVHLTPAQTAAILNGLRVLKPAGTPLESQESVLADAPGNADVQEGTPAFSRDEVRLIAPYLVQALNQALPSQLITFHVRAGQPGDPNARRVVTSGGLFFQDERLVFILANYRTTPFGNAFEGSTISEMDIRSDPLLPIVRGGYSLGFAPAAAVVRTGSAQPAWSYVENQKIVVIDLPKLAGTAGE